MAVSLSDFATSGTKDIDGPRSPNHLTQDGSIQRISFRNPNSLLFWPVIDARDVLATIHSSNAQASLTFSGTLTVRFQGSTSHNIS